MHPSRRSFRNDGVPRAKRTWCCDSCAARRSTGVSRDSQGPAHELEGLKRAFLEAGTQGLKRHVDPDDRELLRTRAKLGELMMWLELAEDLIEKRGLLDEWKKRKS